MKISGCSYEKNIRKVSVPLVLSRCYCNVGQSSPSIQPEEFMINEQLLRQYAQVILKVGVNLQPGKSVEINSEPVHADFLVILAQEAYKMGARFVRTEAKDPRLLKARIDHSDEQFLPMVPSYLEGELQKMIEESWCYVHIGGQKDPDVLKHVNKDRETVVTKANQKARMPLMHTMMTGKNHWTIAAMPTPGWAAKVFKTSPSDDACQRLWNTMVPILRLDQPDPLRAWTEHARTLVQRSETLNKLGLTSIRFKSPGTDLNVSMMEVGRWMAGNFTDPAGQTFIPNLPTEEVFTTPDFRKTEGKVRVTRPVRVLNDEVRDAWFSFKEGKVVDYGASHGKNLLEKYFSIDEQARYLGEVALVDVTSPIYRSQLIFENILFDENAACHMALGRGLPSTVKLDHEPKDDELMSLGCNMSLVHTDFMISSDETSVIGRKKDGGEVALIENGKFRI